MITTEEITKSYGRNLVLRGITFCAAVGRITLLVGPNGAGKSTTIKVLAGLIRPNSGNARINKIDIAAHRIGAQRSLAYLPQRPSFHPRMYFDRSNRLPKGRLQPKSAILRMRARRNPRLFCLCQRTILSISCESDPISHCACLAR